MTSESLKDFLGNKDVIYSTFNNLELIDSFDSEIDEKNRLAQATAH